MSEQYLARTRAGLQGWAEVEGHVVLHFLEGPRDERTLITFTYQEWLARLRQ